MPYTFGPLNKLYPSRKLEELVSLILLEPTLECSRILENGRLVTLAFYNTKTDEGYDLKELLTDFNSEHIYFDDELLSIFNEYLKQPERQQKARMTFLNVFTYELTDERISKMTLNEDIAGLSCAEIKSLNIFSQERSYFKMKAILTGDIESLSHLNDAEIIECFLLSMVVSSAINKPLSNGKAKVYHVYRGESDQHFMRNCKNINSFYFRSNKLTSATTDLSVTNEYVSYTRGELKIRIEFLNARAKDISDISFYNREQETVLCNHTFSYTRNKKPDYFSDLRFFAEPINSPSIEKEIFENKYNNDQISKTSNVA